MLTKQLGHTSMQVPAIGLGAGDYFWNSDLDHGSKVGLLHLGIELGMNLIDTAEEYGKGRSEEIVGEAIHGMRDKVIVSTKFSPENNSYNGVLKAVEGSLKRLGTDYIDIYQAHWSNPSIPVQETMRALRHLVDNGTVRCVGVGNFSQSELTEAQEALGKPKLAALQTEYNLFERTIEYSGLLSYCTENDISVVAYSPLDQGRLSAMGPDQVEVLRSIAEKHGKTIVQVVLRRLVHSPAVVAVTRMTKERHLKENRGAMDFDLSDDDVERIDEAFPINVIYVPTGRIRVSLHGEWEHKVYQTIGEAMENKHGFIPSPLDLAKGIGKGEFLKPIRLIPSTTDEYDYDLIGGRVRYWAWVIAHGGNEPIPAYVREGIDLS